MEMNELITGFYKEYKMGVVTTLDEYMQMNHTGFPDDGWDFTRLYLPNYYTRNDVLKSDILFRYVHDEEVNTDDLAELPENKDDAAELLRKLDAKLLEEAILSAIAKDKICPKCGGIICYEKVPGVDYPYFCPECDENYYDFEVEL